MSRSDWNFAHCGVSCIVTKVTAGLRTLVMPMDNVGNGVSTGTGDPANYRLPVEGEAGIPGEYTA
jgi:hypothetical protein